jgi:hypothetical protein
MDLRPNVFTLFTLHPARTPLVAATIKKIKVSADGEPQGGAGKLLPVVESAPAEVEPPDPVMTPEVVGEFGTGDAMLALELEELRRKNTQIQQEVQNLQERSRQKVRPNPSSPFHDF